MKFIRDFRNNSKSFKTGAIDNENKCFGLTTPRHRVYRANKEARVVINEVHEEQYAKLYDYANEIKKTNI